MDLKGSIIIFLTAIIGLVFLIVIADETYVNTDSVLENKTNQTHMWELSITEAFDFDVTQSNARWTLSNEEYYASWGNLQTTNGSALTEGTHYNVTFNNPADTVTIQLDSSAGQPLSEDSNETLAEYYRYASGYVQGSNSARTILRLNKLWYALGILMFISAGVMAYLKKYEFF